jgi:hypothetical protein
MKSIFTFIIASYFCFPIAESIKLNGICYLEDGVSAVVREGNYLIVKARSKSLSFTKRYEVDYIEIRHCDHQKLSLTFISGKNALDIDFYPAKDDWISNKVTLFGATSKLKKGQTLNGRVL